MSTDTQRAVVLAYLRDARSLTQLEALQLFGISRLAARVEELRREGHPVLTRRETVDKADGSKAAVARYYYERSEA